MMKPVWEDVARRQERLEQAETLNVVDRAHTDTIQRHIARADINQHVAPTPAEIVVTVDREIGKGEHTAAEAAATAMVDEREDVTIGVLQAPRRSTQRTRYTRLQINENSHVKHPNYHPG